MNNRPHDNGIEQEPPPRREDPHPANPERRAPGQQPGERPRQDPGTGPDREPDRRPRQD